jgi:hypothetical protein
MADLSKIVFIYIDISFTIFNIYLQQVVIS